MKVAKMLELYGNADFKKFGADRSIYAYFHSNGKRNDFGLLVLVDNDTDKILRLEITGDNTMVEFDDFFENTVDYWIGENPAE